LYSALCTASDVHKRIVYISQFVANRNVFSADFKASEMHIWSCR